MLVKEAFPFFSFLMTSSLTSHPCAFFWGLFLAAIVLLLTLWGVFFKKKAPLELCLAAFLFSTLSVVIGFFLSYTWQFNGDFLESGNLTLKQAGLAGSLFLSPTYTKAVGLPDDIRDLLAKGLLTKASGKKVKLAFQYTFFSFNVSPGRIRNKVKEFFRETACDKAGIIFIARLLSADTSQEVIKIKNKGPVLTGFRKPVRLVLRELIPELKDKFPAARAIFTDISKKIGGEKHSSGKRTE